MTTTHATIDLWGLRPARLDLEGAERAITAAADAHDRVVIVTPNINHLHLVQRSPAARAVIERADLQLADGWPIVAASRLLGTPLPGRIAGIDLVGRLIESPTRFALAILGGAGTSATLLAARADERNTVVLVDELRPGWDTPARRAELAERLHVAAPTLTLIAIGAPRQEELAQELKSVVNGPIMCCGAAVEVLAGVRPRAPRPLQRLGLEWAFRLVIEPRRLFRRYALAGWTFLRLLVMSIAACDSRPDAR